MYSITNEGLWPKTWPAELEPLRQQARTLVGGLANETIYEINFSKREEFESAWPHLLKVKTKGAPVILRRGPDKSSGDVLNAGVRILCPIGKPREAPVLREPVAADSGTPELWRTRYRIVLVIDGDVVDLNRLPLPADAPIVDERFKDRPMRAQ
jgi:hypothetical protein